MNLVAMDTTRSTRTPRLRRIELILLSAILVVAAILRMGWPGMSEFKADEARLLALALDMAEGQGLALRGIGSSVGFPNFPMSVWLYALPLLLWPHVYAATLFTGLLSTATVAACYWLTRRYWGVVAALTAALFLAASPWAVIYSRKIWAQNLLPLFVMGWVIGAVLTYVERRPKFLLLHLLCLAIAVQIHLAAVALLPVTAVFLLLFRRRVAWRWLLAGSGLALATAVPFVIYLGQNRGLLARGGGLASSQGVVSPAAWRFTGMISVGTDIQALAGPEAFMAFLSQVPPLAPVYWLWAILIGAGMVISVWALGAARPTAEMNSSDTQATWLPDSLVPQRHQAEAGLIVLLWLLGPPLFFTWHNTPLFLHYLIAVLPAPYILAGIAAAYCLVYLARYKGMAVRLAIYAVMLLTAVAQTGMVTALLLFLAQTATPGGFGVPLARQLAAANTAKRLLTETEAAEVLVVGGGESAGADEFAVVYDVLLRDVPHRFVDGAQSTLFPAEAAVVLLDQRAGGRMNGYYQTAVRRETIPLRAGEGTLQLLALPGAAAPQPAVTLEPSYLLANWVNLFGYDRPVVQGGETVVWPLHWHPGGSPDPQDYQFFVHLLNGEGERVGQVDTAAFSPQQWRAGDVVISHFAVPWPDDVRPPFTLRVGMYSYPEQTPVPLLDVAGNPYAEAADITLISEPLRE